MLIYFIVDTKLKINGLSQTIFWPISVHSQTKSNLMGEIYHTYIFSGGVIDNL